MVKYKDLIIGDLIRVKLQIYQRPFMFNDPGETEYFCGIMLKKELRGKNTYITFFQKDPYSLHQRKFCFNADDAWYNIEKVG